jgi:hypothetical protein
MAQTEIGIRPLKRIDLLNPIIPPCRHRHARDKRKKKQEKKRHGFATNDGHDSPNWPAQPERQKDLKTHVQRTFG